MTPPRAITIGILIFFAAFLFFTLQVPDALLDGDSAVYNEQVEKLDLTKRTVHLAYYLTGIGINSISPFSTDQTMNYLSSLFGSLTLVVTFLLGRIITGRTSAALVAVMSLAFARMFWLHAVFSHYHMLQTLVITTAYYAWLKDRAVSAGTAFLGAFLVSPVSVLSSPGFLLGSLTRRKIILFSLTLLPAYGLFVWVAREDYLFGAGRGVFVSNLSIQLMNEPHWMALLYSLRRVGYHLILNFNVLLPLACIGGIMALKQRRKMEGRFAVATGFCILAVVLIGMSGFPPRMHLPVYPLVAICVGLGYAHLIDSLRKRQVVVVTTAILLSVSLLFGANSVAKTRVDRINFKSFALEVHAQKPAAAFVATDWDRGMPSNAVRSLVG